MNIELLHRPGNSAAKVTLEGGEQIVAESGAMIAMNGDMQVNTTTRTKGGGGFFKGLKRMLGGESLFLNEFTAAKGGGEIYLAANLIGDMMVYEMDGSKELVVQGTSFVASSPDVEMDSSFEGFGKAFFSGESAFWLKFNGKGPLILNSFGAIYEKEVDGPYIVDTGHIVAYERTLDFNIRKAGKSWFSAIMGGEGLVCEFNGKGKVYCQSHNASSFGWILGPLLRPR